MAPDRGPVLRRERQLPRLPLAERRDDRPERPGRRRLRRSDHDCERHRRLRQDHGPGVRRRYGQFFAFVAKPVSAEPRLSAGVDACSTPADLPVRHASPEWLTPRRGSVRPRDRSLSRAVGDPEVRSGQRPPGPPAFRQVVEGGGRAPRDGTPEGEVRGRARVRLAEPKSQVVGRPRAEAVESGDGFDERVEADVRSRRTASSATARENRPIPCARAGVSPRPPRSAPASVAA